MTCSLSLRTTDPVLTPGLAGTHSETSPQPALLSKPHRTPGTLPQNSSSDVQNQGLPLLSPALNCRSSLCSNGGAPRPPSPSLHQTHCYRMVFAEVPCPPTAHTPCAPNLTALHLVLPPLLAPTQPASRQALTLLFPLLFGRRVGCAIWLTLCPWPAAPVACALQPLLSEPSRMHSSGA